MRIVVNDVAATPDAGGVYSILSDFYKDVLKNDHENQWFFILAGKYFSESENVKIIVRNDLKQSKLKKFIFELWSGRKFINKYNPEVYISLQNIATYGVKAIKQIVYLHQPIPFQRDKEFSFFKSDERKLAFYQKIVGRLIKNSIHNNNPQVVVQTKWMKDAVIQDCKISKDNISVIHPKVNVNKKIMYNGNGRKFFYPASNFVYKNHKLIYEAIKILNKKGIQNFTVTFTLSKKQLPYSTSNIKYVNHIAREKVMKMYQDSILLFPSYMESFGLPLIEAAQSGDIVLCSDTQFSRELLNNYSNAYYYTYNDARKLADLMLYCIEGKLKSTNNKLKLTDTASLLVTFEKIYGKKYEK